MYSQDNLRERLKNGKAWLEYSSFDDNSYGVLFKDVATLEGDRIDLGAVDFKNGEIVVEWYYTNPEQRIDAEESESVVSRLLEDNFLDGKEEWEYNRRFISDTEVTHSVLNAPDVYGQVLKADYRDIDIQLDNFSEGLFDPTLSSDMAYEAMWVEGENVFT